MTCIFHLQYIYVCMHVRMYGKPHLCVNICWLSEVSGPTTNTVNDANYFTPFQLDTSTLDKGFSRRYIHLVYMPNFYFFINFFFFIYWHSLYSECKVVSELLKEIHWGQKDLCAQETETQGKVWKTNRKWISQRNLLSRSYRFWSANSYLKIIHS